MGFRPLKIRGEARAKKYCIFRDEPIRQRSSADFFVITTDGRQYTPLHTVGFLGSFLGNVFPLIIKRIGMVSNASKVHRLFVCGRGDG